MGSKTPEPSWHMVQKDNDIEVRDYQPMIVAEVTATGERYAAINAGFRILAGYIFGGNSTREKIEMTAPVTQIAGGQTIAMTAPVIQQATNDPDQWIVRFVMPATFTLDSLPIPHDASIKFLAIPAYRAVVIRFSGFNTDSNLSSHLQVLQDWIKVNKLAVSGPVFYAFYDPPWTLPFLRRNEIMMKLSEH